MVLPGHGGWSGDSCGTWFDGKDLWVGGVQSWWVESGRRLAASASEMHTHAHKHFGNGQSLSTNQQWYWTWQKDHCHTTSKKSTYQTTSSLQFFTFFGQSLNVINASQFFSFLRNFTWFPLFRFLFLFYIFTITTLSPYLWCYHLIYQTSCFGQWRQADIPNTTNSHPFFSSNWEGISLCYVFFLMAR